MQYKSNTVWMVRMQSGSLAGLIKSVLQWMATPRRLLDYRQTVTHLLVRDQLTLFMEVGFRWCCTYANPRQQRNYGPCREVCSAFVNVQGEIVPGRWDCKTQTHNTGGNPEWHWLGCGVKYFLIWTPNSGAQA
jgi:hypothetical protein